MDDLISRQALCEYALNQNDKSITPNDIMRFPSAQPEHTNSWCINSWCIDCKEYDTENKCCPRYNRVIKQTLDDAYRHGETEAEARFHAQQRWIPCSERLPEKDGNYLTTLTDKDGNYVDVTEWQNIIRGRWIAPVDECDYCEIGNVVAWMPLPEPYREDGEADENSNMDNRSM